VLSLANRRGRQVGGWVASEGVGRGWRDDKGSLAVEGLAAGGELWTVDATSDSEAGEVYPESGGAREIWPTAGKWEVGGGGGDDENGEEKEREKTNGQQQKEPRPGEPSASQHWHPVSSPSPPDNPPSPRRRDS
jgi:hypothetical protein